MALNTLKCNNCNVVINEVLCYIQYKFDVIDTISLKKICDSIYSEQEIEQAKKLLFESVTTATMQLKMRRKGQGGKKMRDLQDIISFFNEEDPDSIPIFVARDLQKLPPTSIDHIDCVTLFKDVIKLRNELDMIKENYVTVSQLQELQVDLDNLKSASIVNHHNVNTRNRGAYTFYDSGPIGLPPSINKVNVGRSTSAEREVDNGCADEIGKSKSLQPSPSRNVINSSAVSAVECSSPIINKTGSIDLACNVNNSNIANSFADIVRKETNFEKNDNEHSEKWRKVQRKKRRNRFSGNTGKATTEPGSRFKAADVKVPLFITFVNKETSEKDISEYILRKTNEEVTLQKMTMKMDRHYNSFKMYVFKHNLHLYLNDQLWPNGINCRLFIRFQKPNTRKDDIKSSQKQTVNSNNEPETK